MISANLARILVVDDDPSILHMLSRVFGPHYHVTCAPGPAAALDAARSLRPDIAIVDIRMPEMNGFELMKQLRREVADIDVILMTGNAEEPDANLVQAIDSGAFYFVQKPFERRVLLALASRCFELRRLREEKQRHMQRLEEEMLAAQQFQMSLLPPAQMALDGVSISARHVACNALAGDFYDYVGVGRTGAAMVIADVVGHGAAAAMMTSIVKAAFHAAHVDGFRPLSVVNRVKDFVRAFDASRFITVCCARVDLAAGQLVYANAGHPPMILHRAGGSPAALDSTGPLVSSALFDMPCEEVSLQIGSGDRLLFYTDGVIDAAGPAGRFGANRVLSLASSTHNGGLALLDGILAAVNDFSAGREMDDDMTLLTADLSH
jgi:phosphoserine phosphatase RsbU/P